jgi:hypothetical protein
MKASYMETLIEMLKAGLHTPTITLILSISIFVLFRTFLFSQEKVSLRLTLRQSVASFFAGVLILFLGLFPYGVVGAIATNLTWESRHQSLVPLGAAILIVFALELIFSAGAALFAKFPMLPRIKFSNLNNLRFIYYSLLTAMAIVYQTKRNLAFELDSYKQASIVFHLKQNQIVRENSDFIFVDNAAWLNFDNRTFNFYEYTGLMKLAYGEASRIVGVSKQDIASTRGARDFKQYNIHEYEHKEGTYEVRIESDLPPIKSWDTISLLFLRFFDRIAFDRRVEGLITLNVKGPV